MPSNKNEVLLLHIPHLLRALRAFWFAPCTALPFEEHLIFREAIPLASAAVSSELQRDRLGLEERR